MRPRDLHNHFIGRTVYYVRVFPNKKFGTPFPNKTRAAYSTKYFVTGVFQPNSVSMNGSWFARAIDERGTVTDFSFRDCNVLPNRYNCHRLFKTEEEAMHYMEHPKLWKPLGESPGNERLRRVDSKGVFEMDAGTI